jgi:hypothetical protein
LGDAWIGYALLKMRAMVDFLVDAFGRAPPWDRIDGDAPGPEG